MREDLIYFFIYMMSQNLLQNKVIFTGDIAITIKSYIFILNKFITYVIIQLLHVSTMFQIVCNNPVKK